MIKLSDVLNIMDARDSGGQPIPFNIGLVTLNEREETGGEHRSYENVTLAGGQFGKKVSDKNPNHYANKTRNVMIPGKSRPTTIHIDLITQFNGERVFI